MFMKNKIKKYNSYEIHFRMQIGKNVKCYKRIPVRDDVSVIPFLPFEKRQLTDEETRRQNLNNGDNYC